MQIKNKFPDISPPPPFPLKNNFPKSKTATPKLKLKKKKLRIKAPERKTISAIILSAAMFWFRRRAFSSKVLPTPLFPFLNSKKNKNHQMMKREIKKTRRKICLKTKSPLLPLWPNRQAQPQNRFLRYHRQKIPWR